MNYAQAIVDAKDYDSLCAAFNTLAQQPERIQVAVINALNEQMLPICAENIYWAKTDPEFQELVKKYNADQLGAKESSIVEEMFNTNIPMMEKTLIEVHKIKQDDSHPLVNEFLSESMLLSDSERTVKGWQKAIARMKISG